MQNQLQFLLIKYMIMISNSQNRTLKSGILFEYINNIGILFTDLYMNNFFN